MKKKITVSLFAALVFGISASAALGQNPTRIKFKPGAKSVIVKGSLNGYKSSRTYVVRVRAGQRLTTENSGDSNITIGIDAPRGSIYEQDMAADCHDRNEVKPTAAGNYKIAVTECRKADPFKGPFKFKLYVH